MKHMVSAHVRMGKIAILVLHTPFIDIECPNECSE